jgi:hypothetical protein
LTLTPLKVEIIPSYSGDKNYGNLALRISGPSKSKDYPLWESFDNSAKTETITIPIADILNLSEIQKTNETLDYKLMLDEQSYPQSSLAFQIVALSDPRKPFRNNTLLNIKNTPWFQHAKIADRGEFYVDYSLKNLGVETTFYCRMNVAKVITTTNYGGHDFWGDTEVFHYGPDCDPFILKNGEAYENSFLLDKDTLGKDFTAGRYIVQIYTWTDRNDVQVEGGKTIETSSSSWLLANSGDLLTFIICNDPGKNCEDSIRFPIEQGRINVRGANEKDNGYSSLKINTFMTEESIQNEYDWNYSIDPEKDGWVGLEFVFHQEMDFSSYNAIRFKIKFDESPHRMSFQMISTADTNSKVIIGDGDFGTEISEEQIVVIPFDAFSDIDWTSVTSIYIVVDEYMVPDINLREAQISEIEFIRE